MTLEFRQELESLINIHSIENGSDTPDFILCEYLMDALAAFHRASNAREKWYGRKTDAEQPAIVVSLPPRAAVLGFAAWLTTRDEAVTFGASHDCAIAVELVQEFCNANGLAELPDGWQEQLKHPPAAAVTDAA